MSRSHTMKFLVNPPQLFLTRYKVMCNKKYKNLNNLHKHLKVFPVGRNMCHNNYFHPIHILTSLLERIIIQSSKPSCECTFFSVILLSKHKKRLKLVYYNGPFQERLLQPFNDWIIKYMMNLLKTMDSLKIWFFNQRHGIIMRKI